MTTAPCACLSVKFDHAPHDAPAAAHDMLCEEIAELAKTFDFFPLAAHEAGHAVAAAIIGRPAKYVTISLSGPHTMYSDVPGDTRVLASIFCTVAGKVGDAVATSSGWFPSWPLLASYIERARAGEGVGHCDCCQDARLLVESFQHMDDQALVENWREMFRLAFDVFYDDDVRGALLSVASALIDKTILHQDEIAQICDRYSLPTFKEIIPCNAS
ncbi:hypothetical protein [Methylocystis rosea]|uniref:Peptidase M41 domain-containing protein n=1 Tax=Methylocystis rosea TaxID=173366 RepID=A0A3G8M2P3_9HYPH|nr:hypothetical protein [Methylocystis rosea]AZG75987.1 hypothetical protein EHO51_04145 [Methylocystis rosea]